MDQKSLFSIVFLGLSLVYFFSKIFFGVDFSDSFYHINVALNYPPEKYPATFFLSSYLIKGISFFAGKKLIVYRAVNAVIFLLSILVPFLILNRKLKVNNLLSISFILILVSPLNANILGYDTFTLLSVSLAFSLLILYLRTPSQKNLSFLVLTCILSVFVRLPNLILIPIVFTCIFLCHYKSRTNFKLEPPIIYLAFTTSGIILGFLSQFSGLEEIFNWENTHHKPLDLLKSYSLDALYVIVYSGIILMLLFFYRKYKDRFRVYWFLNALFFSVFLVLGVGAGKFSRTYALLLIAIVVVILGRQLLKEGLSFKKTYELWVFLLLIGVTAFGSNTGLLKASFIIVLIPIIFCLRRFKDNMFFLTLLIPLSIFSIGLNFKNIYEDSPVWYLNAELKNELEGIRTSKVRKEYLENLDTTIDSLQMKNFSISAWGDKSHIINYLYPETDLRTLEFFQPLNVTKPISFLEIKAKDSSKAVILNGFYLRKHSTDTIYKLEKDLLKGGYKRLNGSQQKIYWKE